MNFAAVYQKEMNAVVSLNDTQLRDLTQTLQKSAQLKTRSLNEWQFIRVCLVVLLLLGLLSVAAFAALRLLSAREVAQTLKNDAVAALFAKQDDTALQSITDGDYTITLLGTATGTTLEAIEEATVESTHTYAVLAVTRPDGQSVTPEESAGLLVLPLIGGYPPAQLAPLTMSFGRSAFYRDGAMYTLVDMTDLTPFSDYALWLCVLQNTFPTADVLGMDKNGDPVYQESYTGVRALFRLPADPAEADAQRAADLLQQAGLG